MPQFLVKLHGRNFVIPGQALVRGFLTVRKVIADDAVGARQKAEEVLLREDVVQEFIQATREKKGEDSWSITAETVYQFTLWGRLFNRVPTGFIFYEGEE